MFDAQEQGELPDRQSERGCRLYEDPSKIPSLQQLLYVTMTSTLSRQNSNHRRSLRLLCIDLPYAWYGEVKRTKERLKNAQGTNQSSWV